MFVLLFLFLFSSPIFADDFNILGDSGPNEFFQATALTTESFPVQGKISFDENELLGQNTTNILNTQSIFTLANMGYTRRIPNIADKVYGPPGTKIDLLYFYQNNTGHSVNISEIAVPLSRSIVSNGDISRTLNIVGVERNVEFLFSGNNLSRGGKYVSYDGLGEIANGVGGGILLDSWYIQDPLTVELLKAERDLDIVNLKVKVKNITEDEYFTNLNFKHKEYQEVFALLPSEERYLEYSLKNEEKILEPFTLTNPNGKERCAVLGGNYYQWYFTDSISVFAKRENDKWVGGGYVQPAVESICVKRIGYELKSEEIQLESREILGVADDLKELPQTNSSSFLCLLLFVVLDVFLWYAFLRRKKKYEDKNSNTRLCSKSR
ncbi:MAG TPA: hypothetical protein PKI16_02270 [Candidatus Dojkabacteria bacterium]|nr:hypothetical protein [Candidatus Dojkabacteria bacterium]